MAFQVVPNTIRCEISGSNDSQPWACVVHFGYGGAAPTQSQLQAIAQLAFQSFVSHLMPLAPEAVTTTLAILTDLGSQTGNQVEFGGVGPGTAAGTELGGQVAALVGKLTNYRYRGGHGRTYLPVGTSADLETSSTWTPNFITQFAQAYTAFSNAVITNTTWPQLNTEVIVHRRKNDALLAEAFTTIVEGFIGRPMLGTQRRRLHG